VGDLKNLQITQLPIPQPQANHVILKVAASAINPSDVKNVLGGFPFTTVPRVPGRDFAGTIVDGPVDLLHKEVWGSGNMGFTADGANAEYMLVPTEGVRLKPSNLSVQQASAVGVPFVSAWVCLVNTAKLQPKETVVVIGARGAVGSATVQIARWRGAQVIGVVRSASDATALTSEGAVAVNSQVDDVKEKVHSVTGGMGADVVVDTVGGPGIEGGLALLKPKGRLIVMTAPPGQAKITLDTFEFYRRELVLLGVNTSRLSLNEVGDILDKLKPGFEEGALKAPDIRTLQLEDAVSGYEDVQKGAKKKVVLVL